jgi:hypothetical protein
MADQLKQGQSVIADSLDHVTRSSSPTQSTSPHSEGGVNCLFPYEVNGCTHPAKLLGDWGKDLRIMGGVGKMALGAGRDAVKAYLEHLAPLVERGGYIPFCDHRCPPNVDPQDYLYYLDLKEAMFGLR